MLLYNNSVLQYKWFSFVWDLSFADCMRVVLRDVTPWAVLGRPTVGLLYTVLSLTHTHTHTLSLSLSLSLSLTHFYGASGRIRVMVFSIEASRLHSGIPHSVERLWTSDRPDAETST